MAILWIVFIPFLFLVVVRGGDEVQTCSTSLSRYVVFTPGKPSTALSVKIRSLELRDVSIWFDDGEDGIFQGVLKFGQETTMTSYSGHEFYFKYWKGKEKDITQHRIRISSNQVLYLISFNSSAKVSGNPNEMMQRSQREVEFLEGYFQKTGRHWLHYFNSLSGKPRPPPVLNMWPSAEIGSIRTLTSAQLYWVCGNLTNISCRSSDLDEITIRPSSMISSLFSSLISLISPPALPVINLKLQAISNSPRAFLIENFVSDFEVNEIIRIASPRIKQSSVGQDDGGGVLQSDTRTSSNTWIKRSTSLLIDTIHRRVADALGIDESLLSPSRNAEDIQVVHYGPGEEYQSHFDWGVRGYPESRFITVLLYLSDQLDQESGGETAFPKGEEKEHPGGFKIIPKKGNAVIFYSLLEDGNGDANSLHASLPVLKGDKWLANIWIWDPILTESIRKATLQSR